MKAGDLVYVVWIDASVPNDDKTWHDIVDLADWMKTPYEVHDVGFVMQEDKQYLHLCGGYIPDTELFLGAYHRELKIPKGCIVKIRKLKK